jgi:hypothetical protein
MLSSRHHALVFHKYTLTVTLRADEFPNWLRPRSSKRKDRSFRSPPWSANEDMATANMSARYT